MSDKCDSTIPEIISLNIKTLTGTTLKVEAQTSDTIGTLKARIQVGERPLGSKANTSLKKRINKINHRFCKGRSWVVAQRGKLLPWQKDI